MEVDGHPPAQAQGASAVPVAQVALTPFNHSPMTDRGRQIVERARVESPHLVASPPLFS
jgi:flagellar hook-length control protein FliK